MENNNETIVESLKENELCEEIIVRCPAVIADNADSTELDKKLREKCWSIFQPYLMLCRLFGLSPWSSPSDDSVSSSSLKSRKKFSWTNSLTTANAAFTFLLILFCVGRGLSFQSYPKFSAVLVFKFLLLLYAIHCLTSYLTVALIQRRALPGFVRLWVTANRNLQQQDAGQLPGYGKLRALTRFGVLYIIGCSLMNGCFVGFGSVGFLITFPFIESYLVIDDLKWVNGLIVLYTSIGFCTAQMVYCSVCSILLFEYWNLQKRLFRCDLEELKVNLSEFRRKHFVLMKLTESADGMLSYYAFAIYAFNLPTLIMTAFLLSREPSMNAASKVTFALWVGVLLFQICIVSLIPSAVNYLAHTPLKFLEEISNRLSLEPTQMSSKLFRQLSLFIGQLTSTNIGITGGGFFVITKNMLLTVVSIVISYFALIIQFDLSAKTECVCHFNETVSL